MKGVTKSPEVAHALLTDLGMPVGRLDDVVKGTLTVTLEPDASFIEGAPLRFASNHVYGTAQNLLARFTRVVLSTSVGI